MAISRVNPWVYGLTLGLLFGLVVWLIGFSPWPLVIATLIAGALALAQFSNLRVGITGALLIALGGYAVLVRFFPHTTLALDVTGELALALAGAVAIFGLGRASRRRLAGELRFVVPSRAMAITAAVLLGVALLIAMAWLPWRTAVGEGPVWAMHNDATVQMIKARPIVNNGGVNTAIQRNSSPLTSALIAMSMVVGRSRLSPEVILQNDVTRAAQLWVLLIFATCILAALICWRATRGSANMPLRIVAAALVGVVPLTWYYAGFAISAGFYNSTLTLLILLAAWHIWLESDTISPVLAIGLLSIATVAMLATWAPVAVIPAALAGVKLCTALWRAGRQLPNLRPAGWLPLVLAALPIPLYALLVSLRDLGAETEAGDALAADGHIHQLPQTHVLWVLLLTALLVALTAVARPHPNYRYSDATSREPLATRRQPLATRREPLETRRQPLWGLVAIYLATALMMAFLFYQRWLGGRFLWGYYPIKAIWAVTSLLIVIGITTAIGFLSTRPIPQSAAVLGTLLSVAVAGMLLWQMPPANWRYVFTPFDIIRGAGSAAFPWRANTIFDANVAGEASMLVRYDERWDFVDTDRFANLWLLQLLSTDGDDPIRMFAYLLDPHDEHEVCQAITTWNRHVTVWSSDPGLAQRLAAICPGADFAVKLDQPPTWGPNPAYWP